MVTKGYQKGVYKWVTLGISGGTGGSGLPNGKALFGGEGAGVYSFGCVLKGRELGRELKPRLFESRIEEKSDYDVD
jgi:hypothetical protein